MNFRIPAIIVSVLCLVTCSGNKPDVLQVSVPSISGMNPSSVSRGQKGAEGIITGSNLTNVTSVTMGEGIAVEEFRTISSAELSVRFSVNGNAPTGSRIVNVTNVAGSASASVLTVIKNKAPKAVFSATPSAGSLKVPIEFDASSSDDNDGQLRQYQWDFGDGSNDGGKKVSHLFKTKGTFTVTLTVKDDDQAYSIATKDIEILDNAPPVAKIKLNPGAKGNTITTFQFDGTGSFDPEGAKIASHVWDFGDNTKKKSGAVVTHKYGKQGMFDLTLTVMDKKGNAGSTTRTIEVEKVTEVLCKGPGKQGYPQNPDIFIDVLSWDKPYMIARIKNGSTSCDRVWYKCGDIRKGGIRPGSKEEWWGTICAMWDRGDGTYRIHLVRGTTTPRPGEGEVYIHAQDCSGGYCKTP